MKKTIAFALILLSTALAASSPKRVIDVSRDWPRYFADASGKTWIPIGCNICFDRLYDGAAHSHAAVRANFERWLRAFAANGGNCTRLWAGHASLEIMPDKPGVWDEERTRTLLGVVKLAEELGIKVKITFESFRQPQPGKTVFNRALYAPYAKDMRAFLASEACYRIYFSKVERMKALGLGDSPAVYCWELWNEINCIGRIWEYAPWSDRALADLRRLFPKQMTVQNLGSFSDPAAYQIYDQLATIKDNSFLQVHRYLDGGAQIDACRAPMDVVAATATGEMLDRRADVPVVVAEIGAVEPNHTGPSRIYDQDRDGVLLHDATFAPFFCGSAGSGQFWHWDHQYIDRHGHWHHFRRFARAIEGLDPVAERFTPFHTETRRLRVWGLRGRTVTVLWCRDKENSWEDEFTRGQAPRLVENERLPFAKVDFDCYLPWEDRRVTVKGPTLPPFKRSIVVRLAPTALDNMIYQH